MALLKVTGQERRRRREISRTADAGWRERERVEMVVLADEGWSAPRIARHLGCCAATVRRVLRAYVKHVCEQLVNVDAAFQGWLHAHFQLVRRILGVDRTVKALDGLPTQVLAGRMNLPLFRAPAQAAREQT